MNIYSSTLGKDMEVTEIRVGVTTPPDWWTMNMLEFFLRDPASPDPGPSHVFRLQLWTDVEPVPVTVPPPEPPTEDPE